jgi:hypothetical protein
VAVSKKRMLADVLWEAANLYLHHAGGYSCFALDRACKSAGAEAGVNSPADKFLKELGCETGTVMKSFPEGEVRQGIRYMWLLLAMHVAENEGITV